MATEAGELSRGVFVNRVTRGHKRTFLQLSIPNEWVYDLVDPKRVRFPEECTVDLAILLDQALHGLLDARCDAAGAGGPAQTAPAPAPGEFRP